MTAQTRRRQLIDSERFHLSGSVRSHLLVLPVKAEARLHRFVIADEQSARLDLWSIRWLPKRGAGMELIDIPFPPIPLLSLRMASSNPYGLNLCCAPGDTLSLTVERRDDEPMDLTVVAIFDADEPADDLALAPTLPPTEATADITAKPNKKRKPKGKRT